MRVYQYFFAFLFKSYCLIKGMRPFIFSKKSFEENNKDWAQGGENVTYVLKEPRYMFAEDNDDGY